MKTINVDGVGSTSAVMDYVANNPDVFISETKFEFNNETLLVSRDYSNETESLWDMVDRGNLQSYDCGNDWERTFSFGSWYCRNKKLNIRIWITPYNIIY